MNRKKAIESLKTKKSFDVLVIGGGATGSGVVLDAISRGLKVALVERNDFAEGTSSRSTKMVHGGVRYLEKAVKRLDREQYGLVKEGLHERGIFLKNAPHLAIAVPFVTPLYRWIDVPQVFAGLTLYDMLSGKMNIGKSQFLSKKEVLKRFPMVNEKKLRAGVMYYDGQFNDARMAVYLIKTAVENGAVAANHVEVTGLIKDKNNKVKGAHVKDLLSGEEWSINATCVVNSTGPFADSIRKMDDPEAKDILKVSSGIHIVLDKRFAPPETGLMIPSTEDGRVLFVIPWEGHAIVGTTDEPTVVEDHPVVIEDEINYVLRHVNNYFTMGVTRADVKSYWSGLRPLVFDPDKKSTQELARTHIIKVNDSGMVTITGGKWTSYRRMAEDLMDVVVKENSFTQAKPCKTKTLSIIGGENYSAEGYKELMKDYKLDKATACHLNKFYGDRAHKVAKLAQSDNTKRLHPDHPYLEAEIIYAMKEEMAVRVSDMLIRRLPLGLLDFEATGEVADRVIELMSEKLSWNDAKRVEEKSLIMKRISEAV